MFNKNTKSGQKCSLKSCPYQSGDGTLHRLPKNSSTRVAVLKGLGFDDDFAPKDNFRLCSRHFTKDSFQTVGKKRQLKKTVTLRSLGQEGYEEENEFGLRFEWGSTEGDQLDDVMSLNIPTGRRKQAWSVDTTSISPEKKPQGSSCRVCLTSNERELVELYDQEDGESYADMIQELSGLEVLKDDQLPQKICIDCLNKVRSACETRRKCIETDGLLRMQIKDEPADDEDFPVKEEGQDSDYFDSSFIAEALKVEAQMETDEQCPIEFGESYADALLPEPKDNFTKLPKRPKEKTKPENLICVFCNKMFTLIKLKKEHMKAEHSDELVCRICQKTRSSVNATEDCIRDHLYGITYLCQVCGKNFRKKKSLDVHLALMHESSDCDLFACDFCGLKSKHKANLRRHMLTVHMGGWRKFPCPLCPDVSYTSRNSLNLHSYRIHNVPAPITCHKCNAGYTCNAELKAHLKWCTGNFLKRPKQRTLKPYYDLIDGNFHCKICPRTYNSKKNFSFHYQSTHKDNKTCKICDRTFACYINFRRHVKVVHEKIKSFHCEYPGCGKSFGTKYILNNHKNTHTGEKPYACDYCNFRSGDNTTVVKHKKKMHMQEQQQQQQQQLIHLT